MQCCWRKSRSRVPPVPATSTTHSGWLESGFKLVMSSCPILTILKDRCFKVACVDRWHWQTDSRPDKIVCEGAREATAVNGIIGVALRPLALGSRFHVVILITILACCDDACTVWMWTTSWTFWTRFSLTMGALLWIRGGSALKILKRPQTQTASVWWLSESRDAADESTGRTGFRAKSLQRTATIRYHRHPFDSMGKSWPWGVFGCLDAVKRLCAGQWIGKGTKMIPTASTA